MIEGNPNAYPKPEEIFRMIEGGGGAISRMIENDLKENPIEMQNSAYWFKCQIIILLFLSVIIYHENPVEMKKWTKKIDGGG